MCVWLGDSEKLKGTAEKNGAYSSEGQGDLGVTAQQSSHTQMSISLGHYGYSPIFHCPIEYPLAIDNW